MVAFLEKHFEFTTNLPMEECVWRLNEKSKGGSSFIDSQRDIVVRISINEDGTRFELKRDWGRNLYAEIEGQLKRNSDGSIQVSGLGRIRLFSFVFAIWFSLGAFIIFQGLLQLTPYGFLMGLVPLMLLLITFMNRDSLIALVKQTLEAKEQ